jgi:RIO kinase 1
MDDDLTMDKYEQYAEQYAPEWRAKRRLCQLKPGHRPKRSRDEILAELTDDLADVELGFQTTYRPSKHEGSWLLSSLYTFYDEGLVTDVLALVKGGKEANVYCCQAHPATGLGLVAAKVYRPRMFRNLRNDKMYRQGREILVAGGRPAGRDSGYIERAIRNKTSFGQQAAHTSWLMYEFTALERLYGVGGAVPRPIAASENAILMSYHGDEYMAAPTLNTVVLERDEAGRLYREVLRNVDLMLQHGLIHGDLSAYNILHWQPDGRPAEITLIDFPQVVNLRANEKARTILERDIQRTCEYFAQQGVECWASEIAARLWARYVTEMDPQDRAADWSRLLADLEQLPCDMALDPIAV